MKLVSFSTTENPKPRLGAVRDGGIADLSGYTRPLKRPLTPCRSIR
jgi:hypothetical protein